MQALKCSEQFLGMIHIKTHTVVAHEISIFGRPRYGPDLNFCRFLVTGKLDRIREQILKHLGEQTFVAVRRWEFKQLEGNVTLIPARRLLFFEGGERKLGHIDFRESNLLAAQSG